ncbi:Hypothetical predicted protein [Octopus vulgaris]|uniref:Uncharacterized protein n=1 Tax=Octopus vulgaris TaxID=6645 RepID=A0AA36FDZ1_OCTVU|nr:Hypothetical predicted protein [Octopus vulgaris]
MIIRPTEGYYGSSEETTIEKDQVIAVREIFNQERVIGSNSICVLTIPYESDCQFMLSNDLPTREFILPFDLNIDVERAYDVRCSSKYAWLPYYAILRSNLSLLPPFNTRNFTDICIYQKNRDFLRNLPEFLIKPCLMKFENIRQRQRGDTYDNPSILRRPPMPLPRRESNVRNVSELQSYVPYWFLTMAEN